MGNHPSTAAKQPSSASSSPSHTPSPSTHEPTRAISTRKDHPRNLIQSHRTGAAAEPSMAQARGTTAAHRARNSQSLPVSYLNNSSPSQSQGPNSPASHSAGSPASGSYQPKPEEKQTPVDQPSKPVDVPVPSSNNNDLTSLRSHSHSIEPSGSSVIPDMSYHITRPPRLPLPIEEEVHTPGSPIATAADIEDPVLDIDPLDNDELPRRTSALSNTTIDEEDADELNVDKSGLTVPTVFEWRRGGAKVYVTGTIFQWNKKHRLHPVEGQPGLLRAVIHVRPGTHHIRFIVDSIMQCSPDLPTTVDFGNNLVNYIEVSPDDLPREVPATAEAGTTVGGNESKTVSESASSESKIADDKAKAVKPAPKMKPVLPLNRYTTQIPQYLVDLDKAEESPEYQYAAAAIEKLPTPPTLPGFLGKPILNAATPMKDDNSVLTMPNHTVLNHLATSSIKNNVLAVSATTRYKRKYVTTIMYKPSGSG